MPFYAATSSSGTANFQDPLMAKFKPAAGQWECEVCMVRNKAEDTTCVACKSQKPLKFFQPPPGDWTCDTCLISNKDSAISCIACSSARPGPPRTKAGLIFFFCSVICETNSFILLRVSCTNNDKSWF